MKDKFTTMILDGIEMKIPILDQYNTHEKTEDKLKVLFPEWYQYVRNKYPNIFWRRALQNWRKYLLNINKEYESCLPFNYQEIKGEIIKVPIITPETKYQTIFEDNVKRGFPEFFEYIKSLYPNIDNWMERIYLYVHGMKEPPKCKTCGRKTDFLSFKRGYQLHCSIKCSSNDPEVISNRKASCLDVYGFENPMQSELIKEKLSNTIEQIYGVKHFSQTEDFKEKFKKTCEEKYGKGIINPSQAKEVRDKINNTCQTNWGGPPTQNSQIRNKISQTKRNQMVEQNEDLIDHTEEGLWIMSCPHKDEFPFNEKCKNCSKQYVINRNVLRYRVEHNNELCTILNDPKNNYESELEKKVKQFLKKLGINFKSCERAIEIKGIKHELDTLIPNLNIAIEINGNYWHSLKEKEPDYHIEKFIACKNKGIELISIWEDWFNDFDTLKEFILDALNHNDKTKYKKIWFPDLDDSQWPNDLGWCNNPPQIVNPHKIFHGKYECSDSGITII